MSKLRLRDGKPPAQSHKSSKSSTLSFHAPQGLVGFPGGSAGAESACNAGDPALIPGSGGSPGEGIGYLLQYSWASVVAQMVKNPPAMWETWFNPWVGKIPWRRTWQPTPVFFPGHGNPLQYTSLENPHGQRSLAGCSPWGCKESDTTEVLNSTVHRGWQTLA